MNPLCVQQNERSLKEEEMPYLKFDSQFESGNIDLVVKSCQSRTGEHEYDVFIRPDCNTIGSHVWFFFNVSNRVKGSKMKLNIVNMTKRNSLYMQGLQVSYLSVEKSRISG